VFKTQKHRWLTVRDIYETDLNTGTANDVKVIAVSGLMLSARDVTSLLLSARDVTSLLNLGSPP
jgi:hypothetical protein